MTLDYYRIFYYVATYKSFSKAAKILNNNQPNMTRCINLLENELDCELLIRSHKGVELTSEGRLLYEHVAAAMKHLMEGEDAIVKRKSMLGSTVTIGVSESALRLYLLKRLEAFMDIYPEIKIRLSNHSTTQAVNALKNNLVDFAIATTPISNLDKDMEYMHIYPFSEILICGDKYKDLTTHICTLNEVSSHPFISLMEGTGTNEHYSRFFYDNNIHFSPDIQAATTDQILPMIEANLGIGFYPEELAKEAMLRGKISQIKIREKIPQRHVTLLRHASHTESIAAKKLINFLMVQ